MYIYGKIEILYSYSHLDLLNDPEYLQSQTVGINGESSSVEGLMMKNDNGNDPMDGSFTELEIWRVDF